MKKMGINFCSFVEDKLFGLLSVRVSVCVNLLVVVVMVEVTRFEWLCVCFCLFFLHESKFNWLQLELLRQ